MSYNPNPYHAYNPQAAEQTQAVQRGIMTQVYAWMTAGILTTGAVAFTLYNTGLAAIFAAPIVYFSLFLIELGLVWYLSARITRLAPAAATTMFMVYALLNGLTLSIIFLAYTGESIAGTFFATGGMFGAMSAYGYVTKRDLSGWGNFLFMALIGFILASIINVIASLFFSTGPFYWIITYFGILLFLALTIYDTNMIKRWSATVTNGDDAHRVAIMGALKLYLDFINLFLLLLRILGNRR